MTEPSLRPSYPALPDPWDARRAVPLDGPLERDTRPSAARQVVMAFLVLFTAFILFQLMSSAVAVLLLLFVEGIPQEELLSELTGRLDVHARSLLIGNTVGQFLGLALPALVLAGLHTTERRRFLRLRATDGRLVGWALVGLVVLTPVVQWLGIVNEQLPVPEWVRTFEQSQLELIEQIMRMETGLLFNLLVLAVTPAICEEVLFRGYVQRQAERGMGFLGGILFSGILFGLYHLRLTQLLPLTLLGLYLAWLAWRTGSLWAPIVVHFGNNALAVAVGAYATTHPEIEMANIEAYRVPWVLALAGLVGFAAVAAVIHRIAVLDLARRPGAEVASEPGREGSPGGAGVFQ